jgi:hypothetical protein
MSALNFCIKPSIEGFGEDLSYDVFVWASRNIGGRDTMEEFVSCGVWPLATDVSFEHGKVGLTPISKLKVPLPRFPLSHKDDTGFLARVEQEARNIVGSYTCVEHDAYVSGLPNNCRLNHVLELVGVAYGPRLAPVPAEVLKKRKVEASEKVLAKHPKGLEKKGAKPVKVSGVRVMGGLKWPLNADILPARSVKLSKGIVHHTIASVAATRITLRASGSKTSGRDPGSKTMLRVKKAALSAKKRIILAIGALAMISSEGTQESSPHDQAPKVQSKTGFCGQSLEC